MTVKSEFKNHLDECKQIIKKGGYTKKLGCIGFITPEGKTINMCKVGNNNYWNHTDVGQFYDDLNEFEALDYYMEHCRAVRFSFQLTDRKIRVHSIVKPNEKQARKIAKLVTDSDTGVFYGYHYVSEETKGCEYQKVKPKGLDVRRFISKCWR